MWVSPRHNSEHLGPYKTWSIDTKIDVFHNRVDGWHLEIAERIINGWTDISGESAISAYVNEYGKTIHAIPHAGFASLQIAFSYFETIAVYKMFMSRKDSARSRFENGFEDVIGKAKTTISSSEFEEVKQVLWDFRNKIFHADASYGKLALVADESLIVGYDSKHSVVIINPHKLLPALRQHLTDYTSQLREPANTVARKHFEKTFDAEHNI